MDDNISNEIEVLAEFFSHISDPTRLRLLFHLLGGESCVCDMVDELDVSTSAVSHQLRRLRVGNLIKRRKAGRHVYYSLADEHVRILLSVGLEHIRE